MKLIHISDLHIGKRVNEYRMLDDQKDILEKILGIIDDEAPDAVLIAGDIYDKSVPGADAVSVFDDFLYKLSLRKKQVFIISGNHDSPERVAFGGRLMVGSGIYFSPVYNGEVRPVTIHAADGDAEIYMLPFLKPASVRRFFSPADEQSEGVQNIENEAPMYLTNAQNELAAADEKQSEEPIDTPSDTPSDAPSEEPIVSYTDAMRAAIGGMHIDPKKRNILITHQFVTGASRSESEEFSVGGTDNVNADVFGDFDYVALGHIHRPQNCGSERIRYSGTPLKYSFSEVRDEKSVTVVELGAKGAPDSENGTEKCPIAIRTVPLKPLHDWHEIRGTYAELTYRGFYEGTTYGEDYMHVTLTDEEDVPDALGKLRVIYKNLMKIDYDNTRTRSSAQFIADEEADKKSPLQLFSEFFEKSNGKSMTDEQAGFVRGLIEKIWEEGE